MATYYTRGVKNGSDMKIRNYLLKTASAMDLFSNSPLAKEDFTSLTKEQLIDGVRTDTSVLWKKFTDIIESSRDLYTGKAMSTLLQANANNLAKDLMTANRRDEINTTIAGAFYDSLPEGKVMQKRSKFIVKEPNEMEELFGKEYSTVEKQKPEIRIDLYNQIQGTLKNLNNEQKEEILAKKINFEGKSYKYNVYKNLVEKSRYDNMINSVKEWFPRYKNPFDKEIEQATNKFLFEHKKFALNQLLESREADCYNENQFEEMRKAYALKIEKLNKTKPSEFIHKLQSEISTRLAVTQKLCNRKHGYEK